MSPPVLNLLTLAFEDVLWIWITIIIAASALVVGHYFYERIHRELRRKYETGKQLPQRIAHIIAYFLFLLLFREGVTLQLETSPLTQPIGEIFLVVTLVIGVFLAIELVVSIYDVTKIL